MSVELPWLPPLYYSSSHPVLCPAPFLVHTGIGAMMLDVVHVTGNPWITRPLSAPTPV